MWWMMRSPSSRSSWLRDETVSPVFLSTVLASCESLYLSCLLHFSAKLTRLKIKAFATWQFGPEPPHVPVQYWYYTVSYTTATDWSTAELKNSSRNTTSFLDQKIAKNLWTPVMCFKLSWSKLVQQTADRGSLPAYLSDGRWDWFNGLSSFQNESTDQRQGAGHAAAVTCIQPLIAAAWTTRRWPQKNERHRRSRVGGVKLINAMKLHLGFEGRIFFFFPPLWNDFGHQKYCSPPKAHQKWYKSSRGISDFTVIKQKESGCWIIKI